MFSVRSTGKRVRIDRKVKNTTRNASKKKYTTPGNEDLMATPNRNRLVAVVAIRRSPVFARQLLRRNSKEGECSWFSSSRTMSKAFVVELPNNRNGRNQKVCAKGRPKKVKIPREHNKAKATQQHVMKNTFK